MQIGRLHRTQAKTVRSFFLAALLALVASCATTDEMEILRQDIGRLQRDSLTMQSELNAVRERATGSAKEESFAVMRESQAEIQSTVSNLSRDVQVLSGRFDENKYAVEKRLKDSSTEIELLRTQLAALEGQIKEMKSRINSLETLMKQQQETMKEQSRDKEAEEVRKQPPPAEEKSSLPVSEGKTAKYEAAYSLFKNKKYKEALDKFDLFLKEYPKDDLADNAQFWIAEAYYNEKDYEGAILAYEALLKKYPKSDKVPGSLLKQGAAFVEIGDTKTGRVIFEQLIERFPKSGEAELAKKKVSELNRGKSEKKNK
ncbi:MAG: tol-pal system protein YbgF [Nitrospirota bacterium]